MKKINRKSLAAFTAAVVFISSFLTFPASAADISGKAPEKVAQLQTSNGNVSLKVNHADLEAQRSSLRRSATVLPAKFDLRSDNGTARVTNVKSQGANGTCWAFGAISSAESSLLTHMAANGTRFSTTAQAGRVVDLSERQLVWFAFNGRNNGDVSQFAGNDTFSTTRTPASAGGSRFISVPTLARWYGCADEKDLPYQTDSNGLLAYGANPSLQTVSRAHLENAVYLPEPVQDGVIDTAALTAIKNAVKEDGAVSAGYYSPVSSAENARFFNSATSAYYSFGHFDSNHEITIVGWDDHYSRMNFNAGCRPPKDGAWIVKNSWGTGSSSRVGADGYFYLSYYDLSFDEPTSFEMEPITYSPSNTSHEYHDIYQYDGVGLGGGWYTMNQPASFANVFTARRNSTLKAVSAYTISGGSKVTIDVYKNPESGNPTSGSHVASLTRYFDNAGYYTVDLGNQACDLPKGSTFAVVETSSFVRNGSQRYAMLYETGQRAGTASVNVSCSAGQSYMSVRNGSWMDMAGEQSFNGDGSTVGNATIKAFTVQNNSVAPETFQGVRATKQLAIGSCYVFNVKSQSVPVFTSSNQKAAQVRMIKRDAATGVAEVEVYGLGGAGQNVDISMTADGETTQLCTVSLINPPFVSDTTVNFVKKVGNTYCYQIVPRDSSKTPTSNSGNSTILDINAAGKKRRADGTTAYYFKFVCKTPGCAGVYVTVDGQAYRVFYCNVTA